MFCRGAPPLVRVNYYRYFYRILLIPHSTVTRNVFSVIKDGNEYQFLIDCQALNQIKSNLKSILLKLTPKPLIIFILVSNVLTYNI